MKKIIMFTILLMSTASLAGGERIGNGTLGTLELRFSQPSHSCRENCNPPEEDPNAAWKEAFDQAKTLDLKSLEGRNIIFYGPSSTRAKPSIMAMINMTGALPMAAFLTSGYGDLSDPQIWKNGNFETEKAESHLYTYQRPLVAISE